MFLALRRFCWPSWIAAGFPGLLCWFALQGSGHPGTQLAVPFRCLKKYKSGCTQSQLLPQNGIQLQGRGDLIFFIFGLNIYRGSPGKTTAAYNQREIITKIVFSWQFLNSQIYSWAKCPDRNHFQTFVPTASVQDAWKKHMPSSTPGAGIKRTGLFPFPLRKLQYP